MRASTIVVRVAVVRVAVAATVLAGVVLAGPVGSRSAAAAGRGWTSPVEAGVVDVFRPPATRFGPGNRGLEYATVGGEFVRAVAPGRIGHVGPVGRSVFVVVEHDDGLRSTYAHLSSVLVVRGQQVTQGQQLARAAPGFHLTARLGEQYVDPELLFAGAIPSPRLVAGDSADSLGRTTLGGPARGRLDPWYAMAHAAEDLTLAGHLRAVGSAAAAWHHQDCTPGAVEVAPPGPGRTLIQVGGLGSRSGEASIGSLDAAALGYAPGDVLGFSYRGGCTPEPFGSLAGADVGQAISPVGLPNGDATGVDAPGVDAPGSEAPGFGVAGFGGVGSEAPGFGVAGLAVSEYDAADTHQPVDVSAAHLADLIEAAAQARPGRPVDVAAHSLGGVVARRAVEILAERGRLGGPPAAVPLGVVMTIGSPHQGADLANLGVVVEGSDLAVVVDGIVDHRSADSVRELSEVGVASLPPPGAPPAGVTVVAVAGATDLVVPGDHAIWDGARNVVVPPGGSAVAGTNLHADLPSSPEVARNLSLAVAGLGPACVELGAVLASIVSSRFTASAGDLATVVVGVGRYLL